MPSRYLPLVVVYSIFEEASLLPSLSVLLPTFPGTNVPGLRRLFVPRIEKHHSCCTPVLSSHISCPITPFGNDSHLKSLSFLTLPSPTPSPFVYSMSATSASTPTLDRFSSSFHRCSEKQKQKQLASLQSYWRLS